MKRLIARIGKGDSGRRTRPTRSLVWKSAEDDGAPNLILTAVFTAIGVAVIFIFAFLVR